MKEVQITTEKKMALMVLFIMANFVWGVITSLPPAFYPIEAERKGATPHQVCDKPFITFGLRLRK